MPSKKPIKYPIVKEMFPGVTVHCFDLERVTISNATGEGNIDIFCDAGSLLRTRRLTISGLGHTFRLGKRSEVGGQVLIKGENRKIEIGDNSRTASTNLFASKADISIGNLVLMASGSTIRTSDNHAIFDLKSGNRVNIPADVVIEDHVWFGEECLILKGAHVERDSMIGARSLVNSRIPANCVAAGTPARVIREGIIWDHRDMDEIDPKLWSPPKKA